MTQQYTTPVSRPLSTTTAAKSRRPDSSSRIPAGARPLWIDRKPAVRRDRSVADLAAAAVRQANARDCLTILLNSTTPFTVGELAADSGLSRPTVDAVLHDLIDAGAVCACDPPRDGTPGRPARRFLADPGSTLVAGVEIDAGTIGCTVTDAAGRILTRTRTGLDPDRSDRLDAVTEAISAAVVRAGRPQDQLRDQPGTARLAMVGLAVPAYLDHDHRCVRDVSPGSWTGADLGAELSQRLGCCVAVESDLKLAALAEHHLARTPENLIFVELGRSISVAIMVGGRILQGSHRMAGELDAQRGMRWTRSYDDGLNWSTGREAKPIFDRAALGDREAIAEIDDFCAQIAPRLATLMLTVDPEAVIIGGGLSLAGEVLLGPLRRHLDQLLLTLERPELVSASLACDAVQLGALGYAFEQGSEQIFGIPAMPVPWCRLRARTDPGHRS